MMTQNSSCSRIFAVWMVLLAFLCAMIVPSLAIANQEMTIGSEGDPRDGLDYTGGGGGSLLDGGDDQLPNIPLDPKIIGSQDAFSLIFTFNRFFIAPIWTNGQLHFILISDQKQIDPWRAN